MASSRCCRHHIALTKPCQECELGVALAACARVLVKLALLSEVTPAPLREDGITLARGMEPRVSRDQQHPTTLVQLVRGGDATIPHGVNQTAVIDGRERAPSKHLSLHAHYEWRMKKAQRERNVTDLLVLAAQAQREYAELMEPGNVRRDATDADAIERLLSDLRGCSAEEAAAWMAAPGQDQGSARLWVKRHRILNGCDPETGEMRDHPERLAKAVAMVKAGATLGTIAERLGISKGRVGQLLQGD